MECLSSIVAGGCLRGLQGFDPAVQHAGIDKARGCKSLVVGKRRDGCHLDKRDSTITRASRIKTEDEPKRVSVAKRVPGEVHEGFIYR